MSFSFSMQFHPSWQRRYGTCKSCQLGIETGSKVMLGTALWNGCMIRWRFHYDCWLKEVQQRSNDWFFANKYERKKMTREKAAELNRLRAKRYYIKKNGGEPNEITEKLEQVEQQIALVKSYKD